MQLSLGTQLTNPLSSNKFALPEGMVLWLDPSDESTLTMDATIPTNLQAVADKSASGLTAQNVTSGTTQPKLAVVNGRTYMDFVGSSNQFLTLGQPSALNLDLATASHTVFVVIRPSSNSGIPFGKGNSNGTTRSVISMSSSVNVESRYGGAISSAVANPRNVTNTLRWELNPTTHKLFSNGTLLSETASGVATNNADVMVGARRDTNNTGSAFGFTGQIGEIIWYKRALSAAEIATIEGYLRAKWISPQLLLIVGASLENTMLSGLQTLINSTYGVDWTVVDLAVSGETSTGLVARIDADLVPYVNKGAYALTHIGGNDVTNSRPYATATQLELDTLRDNLEYVYDALENGGIKILPCSLSFRDYDDTTFENEENGSLPYNDNIVLPTCVERGPKFCYPDGRPFLDLYRFIRNNPSYLHSDNIHLTTEGYQAYRQFVVDTVVKYIITGVAPTQLPDV